MNGTRVLVLLPLLVGLAHCFSWDIVVGEDQQLKFYYNGTLTHTEDNPSYKEIYSVVYDPADLRVLFTDYDYPNISISSYDLTTGKIRTLVKLTSAEYQSFAYDPVKQVLFWSNYDKIYSISLKPALSNTTIDGNLKCTMDLKYKCQALVVDSCGGYIYWATNSQIGRAAFDGSNREVLVDSRVRWRRSLAIDQQTQTMFWSDEKDKQYYIFSADLNGKNKRIFHIIYFKYEIGPTSLTVSKDYIYWKSFDQRTIFQLPKHHQYGVAPTVYAGCSSSWKVGYRPITAANYTIEEQTSGMKTCEALKSLAHRSTTKSSLDVDLKCYGLPCLNYCFNGNCSITAEGLPNCSCEAGYTGEQCEVDLCYKHCLHGGICSLNEEENPVCQCTAGYEGERCDVATSTTVVQTENTKQEIGQDLRGEVTQVNIEELKRALLFFL